jgi:hypothetical protein
MEIDRPEIYELRLRIEASIKRKIETPADFDFLRGIIWERTHEQISTSTLKRLWGYVDGVDNARNSTLNVLSKALGYENWDAFILKLKSENVDNSDLVMSESVSSGDLKIGDMLMIAWQPNRVCRLKYLGDNQFEVMESQNSKLKVGDTFRCGLFILGEPVYIDDLRQNNGIGEPKLFVIGNKSGLVKLRVENEK